MGRTYIEYRKLLQSLLPKGFFNKNEESILTQFLNGLGDELSRVEGRSEDLIDEAFSGTITELLEEWEEDFNLPEFGQELAGTTSGRRATIKSKIVAVGQQNKEYFEEIALALGWTIDITEFEKGLAGIIQAGVDVATPDDCVFYWMVNVYVSDPNNADILELINNIKQYKPGHTIVLFRFYDVGYSNGFSNGFNAVPWWDGSWWPLGFDRGYSNGFANAYDYDGYRLTGGFSNGFSEGFDSYRGGGFEFNSYSDGFLKPS